MSIRRSRVLFAAHGVALGFTLPWNVPLLTGAGRHPGRVGGGVARLGLLVLLAAAIVAPGAASASGLPPAFLPTVETRTRPIGPAIGGLPFPADQAFDPIVATHPTDPDLIAVSYHRYRPAGDRCGSPALGSALRITRDGGRTWTEASGRPWAGSGRVPNWHATIAWGPGPDDGTRRGRLWWADTTLSDCGFSDHRLSIAWSDDLGETWSPMFTLMSVPSTDEGGYPDITVDRDPDSPGHGTVYAAINWFPRAASEPGFRLVASDDMGRTWDQVEVPLAPAPLGHPFSYRIGQRLRTTPDGALIAVWHQVDATDASRVTIERSGFALTRIVHDPRTGLFRVRRPTFLRATSVNPVATGTRPVPGTTDSLRVRPRWTIGLDVDRVTGRILVALPDHDLVPRPGRPRGTVRVGRSDDGGETWAWTRIRPLAEARGRPVSAHKPSLAIAGDLVVVGLHGIVDLPLGAPVAGRLASVGEAIAVSRDGGATFGEPQPVLRSRWDLEALARLGNRAGLRDRMEATADGTLVWAFADGRSRGRSRIVMARIERVPPALVAGPVQGPQDARTRLIPI